MRPHPAASPATLTVVERAHAHQRARNYSAARGSYRNAVSNAPDDRSRAYARLQFASVLSLWGEYAAAERQLELVVAETPAAAAVWHDLAILRYRRGDTAGAEAALLRAVAAAPHDPRPKIALAALLVNQHRLREAIAQYKDLEALELPKRMRRAVHRALRLLRGELERPRLVVPKSGIRGLRNRDSGHDNPESRRQ